jgi:hypothetical protein
MSPGLPVSGSPPAPLNARSGSVPPAEDDDPVKPSLQSEESTTRSSTAPLAMLLSRVNAAEQWGLASYRRVPAHIFDPSAPTYRNAQLQRVVSDDGGREQDVDDVVSPSNPRSDLLSNTGNYAAFNTIEVDIVQADLIAVSDLVSSCVYCLPISHWLLGTTP